MKSIRIVPIGSVAPEILSHIRSALKTAFNVDYGLTSPVHIPMEAYDREREQYNSTVIIEYLKGSVPAGLYRLLGVTEADLYVPELNFVFGEAEMLSGVAVISLCRLRQEFYGLQPDEILLRNRAAKEAIHEIGHTLGLAHCPDTKCIMHFSNSLKDTDIKGPGFCEGCRKKLCHK